MHNGKQSRGNVTAGEKMVLFFTLGDDYNYSTVLWESGRGLMRDVKTGKIRLELMELHTLKSAGLSQYCLLWST